MRARERNKTRVKRWTKDGGGKERKGEGEGERNRTRPLLETMPPWTTSGKCIFEPRLVVGDPAQPSCLRFCVFSLSQSLFAVTSDLRCASIVIDKSTMRLDRSL